MITGNADGYWAPVVIYHCPTPNDPDHVCDKSLGRVHQFFGNNQTVPEIPVNELDGNFDDNTKAVVASHSVSTDNPNQTFENIQFGLGLVLVFALIALGIFSWLYKRSCFKHRSI